MRDRASKNETNEAVRPALRRRSGSSVVLSMLAVLVVIGGVGGAIAARAYGGPQFDQLLMIVSAIASVALVLTILTKNLSRTRTRTMPKILSRQSLTRQAR